MTKQEIEDAIDENLDTIAFDEDGNGRMPDGRIATDADFKAALAEHHRLKELLWANL